MSNSPKAPPAPFARGFPQRVCERPWRFWLKKGYTLKRLRLDFGAGSKEFRAQGLQSLASMSLGHGRTIAHLPIRVLGFGV